MSIIAAVLVFGLIVLFHEFGHYLMARKSGVCVLEFSLGMGPRIVSFVRGGTRYSLKALRTVTLTEAPYTRMTSCRNGFCS